MGGMEKGVINLINRMDPDRFEHVVCVLRSLGDLVKSIPDRAEVICLGETGSGMRFQAITLARQIEAVQPNIVHSRNWGTIESVFAGRWIGSCAVIHSEHGMESFPTAEPTRRRWLRRLAFQMADRVFTVSYGLRDHHASRTGFPAPKIGVMHNGVDLDRFRKRHEDRALLRTRYGFAADEFCIGTVGRLEPIKDMLTLFRALTELPDSMNWRVAIAGDGSELPALQEFLRNQPELSNRIRFLGDIQDVPGFLASLDVYVLPSLYEGISNSLLEAMASGTASVATNVGGNPEVVVDGESGLLFPVAQPAALTERLLLLYRDSDFRLRLGLQAVQRIRASFSLESMVRQYEQMYNAVSAE
jgi:sugar transferase (PEP-CTERM/EpsH1 system associated)